MLLESLDQAICGAWVRSIPVLVLVLVSSQGHGSYGASAPQAHRRVCAARKHELVVVVVEARANYPMVMASGELSFAFLQLAEVPEPDDRVLSGGHHLIWHVRVVVYISGTEQVHAILLESQPAGSQVPRLQVRIVNGADLLWMVRVDARAAAPLPNVQRQKA